MHILNVAYVYVVYRNINLLYPI